MKQIRINGGKTKMEDIKQNEVVYDCPHCGHCIRIKIDLGKGEDTID